MKTVLLLAVVAVSFSGCDSSSEDARPLKFDPLSCETEESTTLAVIRGLDSSLLEFESISTIHSTGQHASTREIADGLVFGGPVFSLEKVNVLGVFEMWEDPPNDYGAVAWLDSSLKELVFAGQVIRVGSSPDEPPRQPPVEVLVGALPKPMPSVSFAPNLSWFDFDTTEDLVELAVRSEVVARYLSCGVPEIVAYVYTPIVGIVDVPSARGLVMVHGHRANGDLHEE